MKRWWLLLMIHCKEIEHTILMHVFERSSSSLGRRFKKKKKKIEGCESLSYGEQLTSVITSSSERGTGHYYMIIVSIYTKKGKSLRKIHRL